MKRILVLLAVWVAGFGALPASAEDSCALPPHLEVPRLQRIDCSNTVAADSYALSLSWSPKHCDTVDPRRPRNAIQCSLNRFDFVVHGLWGQKDRARGKCEQPRNCGSSLVDSRTVRETLCTIPGVDLIQGEWQKHGTCTGMSPDRYFRKVRELWSALKKPDIYGLLNDRNEIKAGAVVEAFVKENRASGLFEDAVAVKVASRNSLSEVLICYDLSFKYAACTTGRTPAHQTINVVRPRKR